MAVVRDFSVAEPASNQFVRVVEPELDMNRIRPRVSALGRLIEIIRWLTPMGREIVGSPRRSVGRELEEAWPSSDK